jgi:hypothetical protein
MIMPAQEPKTGIADGYQTVWFYQRLSAACAKHSAKHGQ